MRVITLTLALLGGLALAGCEFEVPTYNGDEDCEETEETTPADDTGDVEDTEEVPDADDGPDIEVGPGIDPGFGDDDDTGEPDQSYDDLDGDGYSNAPNADGDATDCDETDPAVNPGATEQCNGTDDDCDGEVDEGDVCDNFDADGDGFTPAEGDCNDDDASTYPGAPDETLDGIDQDCDDCDGGDCEEDGPYEDLDGDGYSELLDCDDSDASVGLAGTWYEDADGDSYGTDVTTEACDQPEGYAAESGDCDDTDATVNPAAEEIEDGVDNNCDGDTDEGFDLDGDGYSVDAGDCDDDDASVNPGASEICDNEIDDDCDGEVDPDETCDPDNDGDGYGESSDCDDTDATVNPAADELCDDGVDNNCDGLTDDGTAVDATVSYLDADSDGYGDAAYSVSGCEVPSGYVEDATDCDDTDATVNPAAEEIEDGVDNNCDGEVDEGFDLDGDGYSVDAGDCDDEDAEVNPGAAELCDGIDNDCDGSTDDATAVDATEWFVDSDEDGFGDAASSEFACDQPSGTVADATDCDDTDASINPDAEEELDDVDNDCDGSVDEDFQVYLSVDYGVSDDYEMNYQVYFDAADLGSVWDNTDGEITSSGAEYIDMLLTSDEDDVSDACGIRFNVNEGDPATDWLCVEWAVDASVEIDVWWLGESFTEDDVVAWIADDATGSCSALLVVSDDASCQP